MTAAARTAWRRSPDGSSVTKEVSAAAAYRSGWHRGGFRRGALARDGDDLRRRRQFQGGEFRLHRRSVDQPHVALARDVLRALLVAGLADHRHPQHPALARL